MDRAVWCPYCGHIGTVTLEAVRADKHTRLFVVGIAGNFVRTGQTNDVGQPIIRCDICNTEVAVERRKSERDTSKPEPPANLGDFRKPRD